MGPGLLIRAHVQGLTTAHGVRSHNSLFFGKALNLLFALLLENSWCLDVCCLISFLLGHTQAKRRRVVNSEKISGRAATQQISSQEANFSKQAELMRTLNTHTHTQLSV